MLSNLFSPMGLRFASNFQFVESEKVVCGQPAPSILLSTFTFTHVKFEVTPILENILMMLLLGKGWAHSRAEQSQGNYIRLQLLWQCLCSDTSERQDHVHFVIKGKRQMNIFIIPGVQQLGNRRGDHKRAFPQPWDRDGLRLHHHPPSPCKLPRIYHRAILRCNHTGICIICNFHISSYPRLKVDLCGYMHFWGLTIDVVSAVNVIIAIGLCVDYSGLS